MSDKPFKAVQDAVLSRRMALVKLGLAAAAIYAAPTVAHLDSTPNAKTPPRPPCPPGKGGPRPPGC
ncbi:MAG: hypothetical protein AB7N54_06815 [Alphaproteobacteria bacterium]